MVKTPSINLFKERKSFFEKFVNWALTIGRLIVIATEVIALSAFLYRFSLDRQLIDLHDKIKQKQAIVASWKENETKYRDLQERLTLILKLFNKGDQTIGMFNKVFGLIPEDFIITNYTYSDNVFRIDGDVRSISSLSSFVKALRKQLNSESVSIEKIENKMSSGIITVSLSAKIKTK